MTREEFISALGAKLSEELSTAEVLSETQYYQGYIDGELRKGKTEAEILEELGDPILIARNRLESPRVDRGFGSRIPDGGASYYEGAYQGENQKSPADIKEQMRASREQTAQKFRESQERSRANQEYKESTGSFTYQDPGESTGGFYSQGTGGGYAYAPGPDTESAAESETVRGHVESKKGSLFRDASGGLNIGLIALIAVLVLVLFSIAWFVGKVITLLGPLILIIIAVVLIKRAVFDKND
ncbi:MAG: hypothetical protein Q4G47_07650 [Lachnospiraceae bacterium]|nr:hypothetical protein [Lachnospiraceae bacterium]